MKSQGKTIIIAEHRLYYLYDLADRIIYLSDGEIQGDYTLPEFQLIPAAEKAKMGLRPLGLGEFADIEPASLHSGQGIWKLNHFHFAYKKQPETLSLENIELPAGNVTAVNRAQWSRKNDTIPLLMRIGKRCKGILEKMVLPIQVNSAEAMLYGHAGCKSSAFYGERFRGKSC